MGLESLFLGIIGGRDLAGMWWNYVIVTLPLGLLWWLMNQWGWRIRGIRWLAKPLGLPPDVRGRWEGELERDDDPDPHIFVLEVNQTLTAIKVSTYTKHSSSDSITAEFTVDSPIDSVYSLCYLWLGGSEILDGRVIGGRDRFMGFTTLRLLEEGDCRELCGEYFTDRSSRQTRGKLRVVWKTHERRHRFE